MLVLYRNKLYLEVSFFYDSFTNLLLDYFRLTVVGRNSQRRRNNILLSPVGKQLSCLFKSLLANLTESNNRCPFAPPRSEFKMVTVVSSLLHYLYSPFASYSPFAPPRSECKMVIVVSSLLHYLAGKKDSTGNGLQATPHLVSLVCT